MTGHKSTALVTGASAGLGVDFCRQLAERCDVIIAVARRRERLEQLAEELSGRAEVHPVEADLTTVEGVARTMEALRQQGPVDYLVNNAGFGTFGAFPDVDNAAFAEYQTNFLTPRMVQRVVVDGLSVDDAVTETQKACQDIYAKYQ